MALKSKTTTNFSLTRRGLMLGAAACAAVALSARHTMAQTPQPISLKNYQRSYLNPQEWAFVMAATARLIPAGGKGPSAHDARVPVFIDKQLSTDWARGDHWYTEGPFDRDAPRYTGYQAAPSPAQAYRLAIPQIDIWCNNHYGAIFAELPEDKQDEVLKSIEKDLVPITELRSGDFFTFLLQNTKEGYFADPKYGGNYDMAAWVYIGFPGARASFLEWVEKDNVPYRLGPVSLSGERA